MNSYVLADWTTKQNIAELIEAGTAKARRIGRPVLVSLTERVAWQEATAFFAAALARGDEGFLWLHPERGFALAGVGVAHLIETEGESRFDETAARWQALLDDAIVDGLDTLAGSGPTLLGGFGFDPLRPRTDLWRGFADGSFVLPRFQLTTYGDAALLTENVVVDLAPRPTLHSGEGENGVTSQPALPRGKWENGRYRGELSLPTNGGAPVDMGSGLESPNGQRQRALATDARQGDACQMESLLPPEQWKGIVAQATEEIRAGAYEKIVLARGVEVVAERGFDVPAVLGALQAVYPWAYTFAVTRGGKTFLGATPERLVGVSGGLVRATALAGTARRGASEEEDTRLGAELMASRKNRHEHDVVVQMLRNALNETCLDIHAADAPQLLKLANVQHLYTPLSGRLRSNASLMDLIARLHPTPAVGGLPTEQAVAYIREHEGLDRGWYAAPVGWMDARKEGDFAVALRSGLIKGNRATLFAGCGIVADSDPAAELAETELKLEPMVRALRDAVRVRSKE